MRGRFAHARVSHTPRGLVCGLQQTCGCQPLAAVVPPRPPPSLRMSRSAAVAAQSTLTPNGAPYATVLTGGEWELMYGLARPAEIKDSHTREARLPGSLQCTDTCTSRPSLTIAARTV